MLKRNIKLKQILLLILSFYLISCVQRVNTTKEQENLLKTDIKFSEMSKDLGLADAYLKFADSNAVWLLSNSLPVKGIIALKDKLSKTNLNDGIYTWRPLFAEVSLSGDLGYTYGSFEYNSVANPDSIISIGTYVSVWKKKKKEDWKWVLNSTNKGL